MSEMALTADHLLVIGRGRIIADASTDEFITRNSAPSVRVRALEQSGLADALTRNGALVECRTDGSLAVTGLDAAAIGGTACANSYTLIELAPQVSSLEDAFFELTKDETEFHAGQLAGSTKGN
jgi:ABC-2 type transport system ATP-binding protein